MLIEAQALQSLTTEIFCRAGSTTTEASIISDHLVRANLAGHDSHGVGMLPAYIDHLSDRIGTPS